MKDQDKIHAKGFSFRDSFVPIADYSKIRVGVKTLDDASLKLETFSKGTSLNISKENILSYLDKEDVKNLKQISLYFFKASGIYRRLCKYLATIYRYDWYCVPQFAAGKTAKEDTVLKDFYQILNYLDNSNLKKMCGDIALKVLTEGCYYGYIIDMETGVGLQELPMDYCRVRYSIGTTPAVEFNMKYFDDTFKDVNYRLKVLKLFPKEFQKGYTLYKEKKLVPEYMGDTSGWYLLDPEKTIKFNIDNSDIPAFTSVIPYIIDLNEAQELDRKKTMQQLLKIIIQKLPMDKNGELIFDVDEARDIHNNAVNMLIRAIGTDVLTTFADVEVADLSSKAESVASDDLSRVERGVFNNAGISNNLFNTDGNTALDRSILNDEAAMRTLMLQFQDFFNKIIQKFQTKKNKKYSFRIIVLETTQYNYKEMAKLYKEQTQIGYSKMLPQIALGHSQSEILNTIIFEEDILHLSTIMRPPLSSNTMSGKAVSEEEKKVGRTEKPDNEKSDKTLMNKESEK